MCDAANKKPRGGMRARACCVRSVYHDKTFVAEGSGQDTCVEMYRLIPYARRGRTTAGHRPRGSV